jgi:hypothetical protein
MEREFVYTCRNCGLTYKEKKLIPDEIIQNAYYSSSYEIPQEHLYNIHNCEGNGHGGYGVADLITIIPG